MSARHAVVLSCFEKLSTAVCTEATVSVILVIILVKPCVSVWVDDRALLATSISDSLTIEADETLKKLLLFEFCVACAA